MTTWDYPGSDPIDCLIEIASGSVALSGEPTTEITVEVHASKHGRGEPLGPDRIRVGFSGGRLEVIQPRSSGILRGPESLDVTVKVPAGSSATIRGASADVSCVGSLSTLEAKTASGDVTVASVDGTLTVSTASGDVWLEQAGGTVSAHTAAGDVRLRQAGGDVAVHTASGDVSVGAAAGSVTVQTASGDTEIASVQAGETNVKTVSGDVSIGVARGTDVYLDLSSLTGDIGSQLDEAGEGSSAALRITCRTVSGDVRVHRAAA